MKVARSDLAILDNSIALPTPSAGCCSILKWNEIQARGPHIVSVARKETTIPQILLLHRSDDVRSLGGASNRVKITHPSERKQNEIEFCQ